MSTFASIFRWLQRKKYQYEVTFSLYMLTPTEKFIFNSFIFLFASMILIAASLYLPHHINFLLQRALFYWRGDEHHALHAGAHDAGARDLVEDARAVVAGALKGTREFVGREAGGGGGAGGGRGEL